MTPLDRNSSAAAKAVQRRARAARDAEYLADAERQRCEQRARVLARLAAQTSVPADVSATLPPSGASNAGTDDPSSTEGTA